jgi:hypothetical protein
MFRDANVYINGKNSTTIWFRLAKKQSKGCLVNWMMKNICHTTLVHQRGNYSTIGRYRII